MKKENKAYTDVIDKSSSAIDFVNDAKEKLDDAYSVTMNQRIESLRERKAVNVRGSLWDGAVGEKYGESKIRIDCNRFSIIRNKIDSDYRNSRFNIDFVPSNGNLDEADWIDGIYMADFYRSNGQYAVDTAYFEAYTGGFGAFRLYSSVEKTKDAIDERQLINWGQIIDADQRVFFDQDSTTETKEDATWAQLLTWKSPKYLQNKYGVLPASINIQRNKISENSYNWFKYSNKQVITSVCLSEVYEKRESDGLYSVFKNQIDENLSPKFILKKDLTTEVTDDLNLNGWKFVKDERRRMIIIEKTIICGDGILEKTETIAGGYIPIIPVWGNRYVIDGVEYWFGHFRPSIDAAILENIQVSMLAHGAATSTFKKPIFHPSQLKDPLIKSLWDSDGKDDKRYLLIEPAIINDTVLGAGGPVGYLEPTSIPETVSGLISVTGQITRELLGYDRTDEYMPSQMSGRAYELRQEQRDLNTYHYKDKLKLSYIHSGKVYLCMAEDIYVEENRRMKSYGENGATEYVTINTDAIIDSEIKRFTFKDAELDVVCDVSPTSVNRDATLARDLTNVAGLVKDDDLSTIINLELIKRYNISQGINNYIRKRQVEYGIEIPTDAEKEELAKKEAAMQNDPNKRLIEAVADQAVADATGKRANVALTVAKTEDIKAKTEKTNLETQKILGNAGMVDNQINS